MRKIKEILKRVLFSPPLEAAQRRLPPCNLNLHAWRAGKAKDMHPSLSVHHISLRTRGSRRTTRSAAMLLCLTAGSLLTASTAAKAQRIVYAGTFTYELPATHVELDSGYGPRAGVWVPGDVGGNFIIAQNYTVPTVTVTYVGGAGSRNVSLDDIVVRKKTQDSQGRTVLEYRNFDIDLASDLPQLGSIFEFAASSPLGGLLGQGRSEWRFGFPWKDALCARGGSAERWRPLDTQRTDGRYDLSGRPNSMLARLPSAVVAHIQSSFVGGGYVLRNQPPSVLTIPGGHVVAATNGRTVSDYRNPNNYRFVITCQVYRLQYSD
ncbi:MAG: hypothetical protein H7X83_09045 [Verrucomicrobia bacterium]|nr:hypothetical protein [Deltaproteobacteria bacterium]